MLRCAGSGAQPQLLLLVTYLQAPLKAPKSTQHTRQRFASGARYVLAQTLSLSTTPAASMAARAVKNPILTALCACTAIAGNVRLSRIGISHDPHPHVALAQEEGARRLLRGSLETECRATGCLAALPVRADTYAFCDSPTVLNKEP